MKEQYPAAFKTKPNEDGLSVNIAALTTPEATAGNADEFGVAEISASTPISLGYECEHNPQPENEAHALMSLTGGKSLAFRRRHGFNIFVVWKITEKRLIPPMIANTTLYGLPNIGRK